MISVHYDLVCLLGAGGGGGAGGPDGPGGGGGGGGAEYPMLVAMGGVPGTTIMHAHVYSKNRYIGTGHLDLCREVVLSTEVSVLIHVLIWIAIDITSPIYIIIFPADSL